MKVLKTSACMTRHRQAKGIQLWSSVVVPGLLQKRGYKRKDRRHALGGKRSYRSCGNLMVTVELAPSCLFIL
jgi:hypothetical protein